MMRNTLTRVILGECLTPLPAAGCHHVGDSDSLPCQHGRCRDKFEERLVEYTVSRLQHRQATVHQVEIVQRLEEACIKQVKVKHGGRLQLVVTATDCTKLHSQLQPRYTHRKQSHQEMQNGYQCETKMYKFDFKCTNLISKNNESIAIISCTRKFQRNTFFSMRNIMQPYVTVLNTHYAFLMIRE